MAWAQRPSNQRWAVMVFMPSGTGRVAGCAMTSSLVEWRERADSSPEAETCQVTRQVASRCRDDGERDAVRGVVGAQPLSARRWRAGARTELYERAGTARSRSEPRP